MGPRILAIRPSPCGDGSKNAATFDVELGPIRLFGLILRRYPDGNFRTFSPNANGRHAVTFHPELAEKITAAAMRSLDAAHSENCHQ